MYTHTRLRHIFVRTILFVLVALFIGVGALSLSYGQELPAELKGIGLTEHLGDKVAIDELTFKDESGQPVKLSSYFHTQKPVIVSLVYFECPNLCSLVLNGMLKGLKSLDWTPGKEFELVTVSIDPREGPALAAKKKEAYLAEYGRPEAAKGWHFLTGAEPQIKKLAAQIGFGYRWDEDMKQFAHGAGIFVLTPEGKISRDLYGIEFRPKDLKLSLLEASNGKIGSIVDRFLMFCFHYDPSTRKYSLMISRVMRAGAGGTVLVFGGYLVCFWRRQREDDAEAGHQGG